MVSAFRSIHQVSYTLKSATSIPCVSNSLIFHLRVMLHSSIPLGLDQHSASCAARGFNNIFTIHSLPFCSLCLFLLARHHPQDNYFKISSSSRHSLSAHRKQFTQQLCTISSLITIFLKEKVSHYFKIHPLQT